MESGKTGQDLSGANLPGLLSDDAIRWKLPQIGYAAIDSEPERLTIEVVRDRQRGCDDLAMNDLNSERQPRQQTAQR